MPAVCVENLKKQFKVMSFPKEGRFSRIKNYFSPSYDVIEAVNDLSFSVAKGERVALIGPNGAGKSTTIKILTGIMSATSGSVSILGKNPRKERKSLAGEMSVLFGHCSKLWQHLPVIESLSLLASIYEIPTNEYRKRKNELVDLFGIGHLIKKPVKQLSLGERMRCELVASFLHKPRIIFLDEPTIGLDILAKATIRSLLRSMTDEWGCTLILTSHDTDDIETVCDRMLLIKSGSALIDDSVLNVKNNYLKKKIITLVIGKEGKPLEEEGIALLRSSPYQLQYEVDLGKVALNAVITKFMQTYNVKDISIEGPSLESIIQTFYLKK